MKPVTLTLRRPAIHRRHGLRLGSHALLRGHGRFRADRQRFESLGLGKGRVLTKGTKENIELIGVSIGHVHWNVEMLVALPYIVELFIFMPCSKC